MAPDATPSGASARRPRSSLLVLFGIVLVVFLVARFWPTKSAVPAARPSNPRVQGTTGTDKPIDPAELDVRLEALTAHGEEASASGRNPFRFYVPPPPPPPPAPVVPTRPVREQPEVPQPPPGPPPIPLKFIGIVEPKPGDRVAAFSDCRMTFHGRAGDVVAGQYKLVQIGVESVTMEYLDGRGRTTIRMSGPECVNK
jgi:hypothetical protein